MIGGHWTGVEGAAEALVGIASACARDEVVAAAMLAAAKPVVEDMRARAPRREPAPDMADSLDAVRITEAGGASGVVVIEIGPRRSKPHSWIARFIEFGTSKMPAQPFMRPTWDEHEGQFAARVVAAIRPAYARAVARYSRRRSA